MLSPTYLHSPRPLSTFNKFSIPTKTRAPFSVRLRCSNTSPPLAGDTIPAPAFGAFFSVAVVSIPTLIAFGRLGVSVKKLSKVVSEEVPGTLSSLKLSNMELNELTQQLSSLRHNIGGVHKGKNDESTARSRSFRKKNPAS